MTIATCVRCSKPTCNCGTSHCTWTTEPQEALQLAKTQSFHAVLTDLKMPGMSGTELCERIVANRPDVPVVVMTAFGSLETAVAAIRAGAYDFVTKPIELDLLAMTLQRAVRHHHLQEKVTVLSEEVESLKRFDEMLGTSPPDAGTVRSAVAHRRLGSVGADHRRKWDGQGIGGAGDPSQEPPQRAAVCRRELRRLARHAARERAVWACQRGLYRCPRRAKRPVYAGRIGHAVPGRDR